MKLYGILIGLLVSATATVACGGDSDSDDDGGNGGASGGSAGSSGKGGTSGGGTAGTSGGGTAGTSGSAGTGSGTCDPSEAGMDMTGSDCPAYDECILTACESQYATCFGPDWQSGDFAGGQCEAAFECIVECDCEETCSSTCLLEDETCFACFFTFLTCGTECEDEAMACEM